MCLLAVHVSLLKEAVGREDQARQRLQHRHGEDQRRGGLAHQVVVREERRDGARQEAQEQPGGHAQEAAPPGQLLDM